MRNINWNQKTKYLINKWDKRIKTVEKVNKAPLTFEKKAALAASLEACSDRIRAVEATNPGSIGQYKRYALDIITAAVPNLIAFDVMAVQPMDNRIGMINYLDYNYSNTKGATKAGTTFNSALIKNASDPNYTSNFVSNETCVVTDGKIQLAWVPLVAGQTITITQGTATPESVTITTDEQVSGKITTGFTGNVTVLGYYYDNESVQGDTNTNGYAGFGANVPEVELKMNSIPVEARARTLRSYWAFDAQYELQKEYGQDIETLLATQVTGELAHEIDTELTLDLLRCANPNGVWSKAITPGISLVDHYDSFAAKLVEDSNKIFELTRKVKANFLICGLEVASVIEVMRGFKASGNTAVGPHLLGTLNGIKVFVNPDYPAKEYVLGYKGNNMFDKIMIIKGNKNIK